MRSRSMCAALGMALLVSGCSVGLEDLPGPASTTGATYSLTAEFTDVDNLTLGADVKLGGVLIGQVTGITTRDYHAAVTMNIEKRYPLGTDARLQIRFTTPLGDDFVSVVAEGHPATSAAKPGSTLPLSQTATAPNVEDTFAAISLLLNNGGLDKLHTIASELTAALNGRTGDARDLIQNLQTVVSGLDANKQDINDALDGLDKLSATLAADSTTITSALDLFPSALQALTSDTAGLRTLLTKVGVLGQTVQGLVGQSQAALLADLDNLQPTLAALQAQNASLIPTFESLTRFGTLLARATPGDYLNIDATISFLLNAQPAYRPPAGGSQHGASPQTASEDAVQRLMMLGGGS